MMFGNDFTLYTSSLSQLVRTRSRPTNYHRHKILYGRIRKKYAVKELDAETGLYYYGARYLDPRVSRWLSGDPAMSEYVPVAPVSEQARKHNQNLPGLGGVFNIVNMHVYHYSANNPVKYVDPDGRQLDITFTIKSYEETEDGLTAHGELTITDRDTGETLIVNAYSGGRGTTADGLSLPIPLGSYKILEPTAIGYRLEAEDILPGSDRIDITNPQQSNIRLHGPGTGLSYGCIGVATTSEWEAVSNMITNTNTGISTVQRYRGLSFLRHTKYGNLSVVLESGLQRHPEHQSMMPLPQSRR